jgi:hypothetical protein
MTRAARDHENRPRRPARRRRSEQVGVIDVGDLHCGNENLALNSGAPSLSLFGRDRSGAILIASEFKRSSTCHAWPIGK